MKKSLVKKIFIALVMAFVFLMGVMFSMGEIEGFKDYARISFFTAGVIFLVLAIALVVLTFKSELKGKLKKFLLITGFSAIGMPIFSVLHNLVYGLFIVIFGEDFWETNGMPDEPLFFILAVIVCPIAFIVGMIGSIILFVKNNNK